VGEAGEVAVGAGQAWLRSLHLTAEERLRIRGPREDKEAPAGTSSGLLGGRRKMQKAGSLK
jgi:hypothetical protein